MKMKCLLLIFCSLIISETSVAQEAADSSMEHVWDGALFTPSDSIQSRYRLFSRFSHGVRYLFVEKMDYGIDFSVDSVKLFSLCCDELFLGIDRPSDPQMPIALEKWDSYNSLILKIGSTRYLIKLDNLPVTNIHAIDEKGNIIDLPPDQ